MSRPARLQTATIALIATAGLIYASLPHRPLTELILYDGSIAVATSTAFVGVRRAVGRQRLAWLLVAVALVGFLSGELIWWWYSYQGIEPFPSIADVVWLSSYLPLGGGVAMLARGDQGRKDRSAWLDASVVTLVGGILVWTLLIEPAIRDESLAWQGTLVSLVYPLVDLAVLALATRLVLSRTGRSRSGGLLVGGLVLTFAGDMWFGLLSLHGGYSAASLIDVVYLLSYALMGCAALDRTVSSQPTTSGESIGRARLLIIMISVLLPQAVLVGSPAGFHRLGLNTATVAAICSTLVIVLLGVRTWWVLGRSPLAQARRVTQQLAAVINHSSDPVVLLDDAMNVRYASPATGSAWGFGNDGRPLAEWLVEPDRPGFSKQLRDLAASHRGAIVELSGSVLASGGEVRVFEGTARNLLHDPDVRSIVVTFRDVTVRHELEAQLERRAFHDDLTGLANRALFADRVSHALARCARAGGQGVAVLFIDLDDFKSVNDGMGHAAGDSLLVQVGDRISLCLRPGDSVARLGGDEFAVLLEDLPSPDMAGEVGQRILEMLALPLRVMDTDLAVAASVGVAPANAMCTVDSLLRDADIAMYSAKSKGKGRVEMFDDSLREAAERHLALKVDLPQALSDGQLRLVYQPIRSVRGQELVGFEALLRWDHPRLGAVPPIDFIRAAEESGLIIDLGRWVLAEATRQAASWHERDHRRYRMNINVSPVQLQQSSFPADVAVALASSGLPPELLTLELTESVLIEHDDTIDTLNALHRLGVGIAIDDFGTGYSSLSYLRRFPITSIKIDRRFITELSDDREAGLVRSILAIAEAFSMTTVAEGVESGEQLEALERMNCGLAQGFFLNPPLTPEEVVELLDHDDAQPSASAIRGGPPTA